MERMSEKELLERIEDDVRTIKGILILVTVLWILGAILGACSSALAFGI